MVDIPSHQSHPLDCQVLVVTQNPTPAIPPSCQNSFFTVNDNSLLFSEQTRGHITQAIQSGWAGSMVKCYSGAIDQFIRFCDTEHILEHLHFPTDEFILCAFAASSLGKHARTTPRNCLSALKAWHITHNLEWKGSARLRYVLNSVHNCAPGRSRCLPHPPVNSRMLWQLIEGLNINLPLDAAVAACAVVAFWGQCHLGELLPSSSLPLLPTLLPAWSDFKKSLRNPHSYILHLPHMKTHYHGQDVVLVDQHPPVNPISLLRNHFHINNIPYNSHIFSYTSSEGMISLTRSLFLNRCNEIWSTLGYPRATGHSFQIGGTTELLIAGTPPDIVKATGWWTSESFLRYWHSLDDIVPFHIRYLPSSICRHRHR